MSRQKKHNIWSYAVCAFENFHSTDEHYTMRIYALGRRKVVSLFFRKYVAGLEHKRLLYSNFSYIFMPVSAHPEMKFGHELVSNSEVDDFLQIQGNQVIVRRRANGTSHKQSRRLTEKLRKKAISGWKSVIFVIESRRPF